MAKYRIIFDGYPEEELYDSYDEAYEAALEMKSNFNQGAIDLYNSNPGDYLEDDDDKDGSFEIEEVR